MSARKIKTESFNRLNFFATAHQNERNRRQFIKNVQCTIKIGTFFLRRTLQQQWQCGEKYVPFSKRFKPILRSCTGHNMNLKELSEHLGLSQTTVSRALNGYPEVSMRTRHRVSEAARQMGYRPNHAARGLATGKAHVIAMVMRSSAGQSSDPHYGEFLSGVGEAALAKGYDMLLSPVTRDNEEAAFRRLAQGGQADGILLSSPFVDDERPAMLDELGIPYMVHGRVSARKQPYAFLDIDNRGAFYEATRLLVRLGHTRIGLINGVSVLNFAHDRAGGFADALAEHGLDVEAQIVTSGEMTDEYGYRSTARMLDSPARPTAILCASLFIALGAVRAIYDRGLKIGSDISLLAHDDVIPFLKPENFRVPLAATRSPIRAAGVRAAERLIRLIDEPDIAGEVWPVDLVVRESIGPAPRS
jgi:LacI family transcriptional regulator